jgi:hypothetical protein
MQLQEGRGTLYQYRPLRHDGPNIRLLKVLPGAFHEPLAGHLENVNLDEAHDDYTALSYVWGLPGVNTEFVIDGTPLAITANLDKALRRLRSEKEVVTAWVDAICIDQDNMQEKSHQVPLMTRIYERADWVFTSLGDATAFSAVGMETLAFLIGDAPFDDNAPWNRLQPELVASGIEDILQRTYFQRVWIVQEAALGRRIRLQVGDIWVQWNDGEDTRRFLTRIKLLEVSPAWASGILSAIDLRPIRELLEQSVADRERKAGISRPATWLDLVHSMRHMQSTYPQDKIYGLMGLASPADVAGFFPDYTESWEETYKRFYNHVYQRALQNPGRAWEAPSRAQEGK